ncbi:hypothetical protein DMS22_24015 [Klebsiella variicola]|nr:hypothetical protein DMS22_24015 [Klebsiella variicola]
MACLSDLSQRLADDGYQWLMELDGLTGVNSKRFRETILSLGICTDLDKLYRRWRGLNPEIEPMLKIAD